MHDLFSSRSAQFDRLGAANSVAAIEQQAEMALLAKADAVVAIQADEACTVRHCLPDQRVIVAPIAITPVAEPQPGRDRAVLFVGSNTAPNILRPALVSRGDLAACANRRAGCNPAGGGVGVRHGEATARWRPAARQCARSRRTLSGRRRW